MTKQNSAPEQKPLSPKTEAEIRRLRTFLSQRQFADAVWDEKLTPAERAHWQEELERADNAYKARQAALQPQARREYYRHPVDVYADCRRMSAGRAIVELAYDFELISRRRHLELSSEILRADGLMQTKAKPRDVDPDDLSETILRARHSKALVIVAGTTLRAVSWQGHWPKKPWNRRTSEWEFLVFLAKRAKGGGNVTSEMMGSLKDRKHHLKKLVPQSLFQCIKPDGRREYRLEGIPKSGIEIFDGFDAFTNVWLAESELRDSINLDEPRSQNRE